MNRDLQSEANVIEVRRDPSERRVTAPRRYRPPRMLKTVRLSAVTAEDAVSGVAALD
jgi:hypothetical protein